VAALGEKLKALRNKRGLSLRDVGKAMGRTWQLLQSYESGKVSPSFEMLLNLAEYYEVSVAELTDLPKLKKSVLPYSETASLFPERSKERADFIVKMAAREFGLMSQMSHFEISRKCNLLF
jgi:transcriptional regulator with XRE-family HTH domain